MKSQFKIPWYLAWQYIRRGRKWTLGLTIFLLAAAFMNLLFISSLFNGIIQGADQKIRDTVTADIYITPKTGEKTIENTEAIINELEHIDGVKSATTQTLIPGSITYNSITGQGVVYAINPETDTAVRTLNDSVSPGKWLAKNDTDGLILGRQIAGGDGVEDDAFSFKGAKVGDKVTLTIGTASKEFTVRGILYTKYVVTDRTSYISEAALNTIIAGNENKAATILVKVEKLTQTDEIITKINDKKLPIRAYSWSEVNGVMSSVSDSFVSVNALMTSVGILIAAITVFIVIYVDILHKRRQIGIFEAIGIRPAIIIMSYLLLSAFYAIVGIIFGALIFYAIAVPYFDFHPIELPICDARLVLSWPEYAWRSTIIFVVSIISGLVPSLIATRGKMLDAILGKQ